MRTIPIFGIALAFVFSAYSSPASAWGKAGHAAIAWIASQHLTPEASEKVAKILGSNPEQSMPAISSWADEILSNPQWKSTRPYHFADLVDPNDYYHTSIRKDGDAVQALIHYEDVLRSPQSKTEDQVSALKFLIHIVGDIHQPLHSGRREDRGGNLIQVTWFGQNIDLHHVWDNGLIEKFSEDSNLPHENLVLLSAALGKTADHQFPIRPYISDQTNFVDWAQESHALNVIAYAIDTGKLDQSYYIRSVSPVNQRLAIAGQRLAHLLNRVFSGAPLTKHELAMRSKVRAICGNSCALNPLK